jgi:hypothetical protein
MKTNRNTVVNWGIRLAAAGLVCLALHAQAQNTNLDFQATQTAADKGDAKSQYALAGFYAKGTGVVRDYAKAAEYLRKAADQGYAPAEVALGSLYGRGRGVPRNLVQAVQWYRKAGDQGDALAQYGMGGFYAEGRGVTNDMAQAIQWWQKAAAQGQMDAQAALGKLYLLPSAEHGTNYLNYTEALRLLRLAADQGSAPAMNNLGVAFENGIGVKLDFTEAGRWYRAAAEQGDPAAQANLGQLYFDGRGMPYDLVQAYKWFKLSSNQGNNMGVMGLSHFQSHTLLKPDQLAAAEQMVQEFKPQGAKNSSKI